MHRQLVVAGCSVVVALACTPVSAAQRQSHPQTKTQAAATSSARPAKQERTATDAKSRTDALAALQDARVTLARLTEESMSQGARDALSRVSTSFRHLYEAYTGEEPSPGKTAAQAAASRKGPADQDWETRFDSVSSSIDRMLGGTRFGPEGPVGTSGAAGVSGGTAELTTPVRQDLEVLRQQLQRFRNAAGGPGGATGPVR